MLPLKILIAAGLLTLAACATGPRMPESLEDRAGARWEALLAGEWAAAYDYLSPGFRQAMSREDYVGLMRNRTIRWLDAAVRDVEDCDPELGTCNVMVDVNYRVSRGVPGMRRPVDLSKGVVENWIQIDGAWYFVPDRLR